MKQDLELIQQNKIFKDLSPSEIENFLTHSQIQDYPKNTLIILRDDPVKYFYIILKGWLKLFREDENGEEFISSLITKGNSLGESFICKEGNYEFSVQAIEDTRIALIPISIFKEEIKSNNKLSYREFLQESTKFPQCFHKPLLCLAS